jgi:hypothetical protein
VTATVWDLRPAQAAGREEFDELRLWLTMLAGREQALLEMRCAPFDRDSPRQWWPTHAIGAMARGCVRHALRHTVYVGAVPRVRRGGTKGDCARAWALWADCDTAASVEALAGFDPAPTFVVLSGGADGDVAKRHAWWALREPLSNSDTERALRRLQHALGSCTGVRNVNAVMRPPATLHRKHGEVRRVTCARAGATIHDPRTVIGHLPDPPDEPEKPPPPARNVAPRADDDTLLAIPATTYVPALFGRELGRNGKTECPFHVDGVDDPGGCLHAYDDERGWFCFDCERGGSIIDLGAELYSIEPRGKGYWEVRRRLAAELLGRAVA